MVNEIIITSVAKAQAALIADLSRKTFYDAFAAQNTPENMELFMQRQFTREALIKEVEEEDGVFLLPTINEQPCGYARMRENSNEPAVKGRNAIEIARIYTLQEVVGKGIGAALMKHYLVIAQQYAKEIIWLGVCEHNPRAIAFYEKFGFEKFGTHIFHLGSDPQTDWLIWRKIS
jgi:ribosomal protein S18 acetylase RimI-like enzyme